MKVIIPNCPACGGKYEGSIKRGILTCEYCGAKFALDADELEALGLAGEVGADEYDGEDEEEYYEDLQSVEDFAREACDDFLSTITDDDDFKCTDKILNGLSIGDDDEVFLIHDDTLFKSGKNGFAITDYGFYCRDMGEGEAHFLYWSEFADSSKPEISDSNIVVDGLTIAYYTGNGDVRDRLCSLYRKLRKHARKFDWSDPE